MICILVLTSCSPMSSPAHMTIAQQKIGLNEHQHRNVLREYVGVDVRYIEWCAAFVNAVISDSQMNSLSDTEHRNPLAARSWLDWGEEVDTPKAGDIVIFPRGNVKWKGHVGFYVNSITKNDKEYYRILGGNQNDRVSIVEYSANKALGIRRYKKDQFKAKLMRK